MKAMMAASSLATVSLVNIFSCEDFNGIFIASSGIVTILIIIILFDHHNTCLVSLRAFIINFTATGSYHYVAFMMIIT